MLAVHAIIEVSAGQRFLHHISRRMAAWARRSENQAHPRGVTYAYASMALAVLREVAIAWRCVI